MVKVAVLGYGTVGSGVVEVIRTNQEIIKKHTGEDVIVKYVLDLREFEGDPIREVLVHDYNTILEDDEVSVVVEVMGGVEPAHTFVKQALEKGKSACTSNKEMVAKHGAELIQIAKEHGVSFFFEASVGGGIPILRPLITSLTCDDITEVAGILNGTTNYILTKMRDEGSAFEDVLKEAQEKGYAERKPEADIEGYDACRKIAILTSLVCGRQVNYEDVYTEGITKITEADFEYAKAFGKAIKLLGIYQKVDQEIYAMVAPMMIEKENPLYSVDGVFNAIKVHGNMVDDVMFYGRGAGKEATASAVVSDVVECIRQSGHPTPIKWEQEPLSLGNFDTWKHKFFVRLETKTVAELQTAKDQAQKAFGDVKFIEVGTRTGETAFVTGEIPEGEFKKLIADFDQVLSTIRVEA